MIKRLALTLIVGLALLSLVLMSVCCKADDKPFISNEPEILDIAYECFSEDKITENEWIKVKTLPLHNINLDPRDYCADLSKQLEPLKPWYE